MSKPTAKRVPKQSAEIITKLAPQILPKVCNTHYMLTFKGILTCRVPEFDASKYKGLKQNCGRKSKHVQP